MDGRRDTRGERSAPGRNAGYNNIFVSQANTFLSIKDATSHPGSRQSPWTILAALYVGAQPQHFPMGIFAGRGLYSADTEEIGSRPEPPTECGQHR